MQFWPWVTALKRVARHIGLWRTLGAQPGEWTGKYSPSVCVFISLWWLVAVFRNGRLSLSFLQIFFDWARKEHVWTGCVRFLPSTFSLRSNAATKRRTDKTQDDVSRRQHQWSERDGTFVLYVPWSVLCGSLNNIYSIISVFKLK